MATTPEVVYSRVVGLGTMNNSVSFKQFLDHLRHKGYRKFVFDLADCEGFDSTFMGILLGLALGEAKVVLVNAKGHHRKLLGDVGIHRLVQLCDGQVTMPAISLKRLEPRPVDQDVRLRLILEAHENLTRLDRRNQEKFENFLKALRLELGENSSL
jgi:hypothetical protein